MAFGIVGSAFMPGLDVFERAGIRFVDVAHEQGAAHMADGYTRATGEVAVCIAQNGPGITNFVTAVAAGVLEPHTHGRHHAGDRFQHPRSRWLSGDSSTPLFRRNYLSSGNLGRCGENGRNVVAVFSTRETTLSPGPVQYPARHVFPDGRLRDPRPRPTGSTDGRPRPIDAAAQLLASAEFPVIVAGAGVVLSDAINEPVTLPSGSVRRWPTATAQ